LCCLVQHNDLVAFQHHTSVFSRRRPPRTEYLQREPGQEDGDEYGHGG
jgi:hypothetical protein